MIRELQEDRDFKLVLCADVWGALTEDAMRELEWLVEAGWVTEGGSDNVSSRPLVTCRPRGFFPAPGEQVFGVSYSKWAHPWAPRWDTAFSVFPGTTM
jgi:hypothetical protein